MLSWSSPSSFSSSSSSVSSPSLSSPVAGAPSSSAGYTAGNKIRRNQFEAVPTVIMEVGVHLRKVHLSLQFTSRSSYSVISEISMPAHSRDWCVVSSSIPINVQLQQPPQTLHHRNKLKIIDYSHVTFVYDDWYLIPSSTAFLF